MDNYQQNFMNSLTGGLRFGQALKAQRDQTQVNRLAGQAYSAAPEQRSALLGQIAQVSPDAAYQQEQNFASSDERRNQTMVNMAKMLTGAPEQARPAIYRQMVPTLSQFGLSELPPDYNEQTRGVIDQAAQSLVQAYGGASTGNNIQSTYVDADGNRVAIFRDGTSRVLGANNQSIRVLEPEGAVPYGVVTSGGRAGQMVNIGGGTAAAASGVPAPPSGTAAPAAGDDVAARARAYYQRMRSAGLDDTAANALTEEYLADMGYWQGPPTAPPSPAQQPAGTSFLLADPINGGFQSPPRTPTAAERAGDAERAKLQAQLEYAPQVAAAEAAAAGQKARAESAADAVKKAPQYQNVVRGLDRIDEALKGFKGWFADTGPVDKYLLYMTPEAQELRAAVGSIQNDMLALTRVPGVGSQSDLEARIANLKYPDAGFAPEVNARNLQQLREFIKDFGGNLAPPGSAADAPPSDDIDSILRLYR